VLQLNPNGMMITMLSKEPDIYKLMRSRYTRSPPIRWPQIYDSLSIYDNAKQVIYSQNWYTLDLIFCRTPVII
jgi:hypothetical protein